MNIYYNIIPVSEENFNEYFLQHFKQPPITGLYEMYLLVVKDDIKDKNENRMMFISNESSFLMQKLKNKLTDIVVFLNEIK